jgi:hypothetical protein
MLSKPAGNGSRRDRGHGRAMPWHAIAWQSCLPIGLFAVGAPEEGERINAPAGGRELLSAIQRYIWGSRGQT